MLLFGGHCKGYRDENAVDVFHPPRAILTLIYNRCGEASERQRTAVPVVYGIECSAMMKLKFADEVELCHVPLPMFCHPLLCGDITLFGGIVSFALSGGVVGMCQCERARVIVNGCVNATENPT